ncbi:MAG: hypothetical protein GY778_02790 [bacterium]|nr:hypothetical protein [bacterium]
MVALILWLFDRLAFAVRAVGADYGQFRAILEAKLLLDNRRRPAAFRSGRGSPRGTFGKSLIIYVFMGSFIGLVVFSPAAPMTVLTLVHAFVMVLVGMSLIADFPGVLIDPPDLNLLGPRPVSGRTILAARLAHICTYLGLIGLALSMITLIGGTIKFGGLFAPVFLGMLALSIALVVFIVNLFYLVALHFTDTERFKDLIVYFQVAMTVVVVGGYQLLPRLMDMKALGDFELVGRWWTYLMPPCWFAGPTGLVTGQRAAAVWVLAGQSVVIPLVGLFLVVRYLAPGFSRSLRELGGEAGGSGAAAVGRGAALRSFLSRYLTRTPVQRVGFELVWNVASRDRQFKTRAYPQLAFLFVFPLILLMVSDNGPVYVLSHLAESKAYLFPLYLGSWLMATIVLLVEHSNQFAAAWIFEAFPVDRPGELMIGGIKAIGCRFIAPVFAVLAILLPALAGIGRLVDVALALCLTGVITMSVALIACRGLPFSSPVNVLQSGGRFGRNLGMMLVPGAAGGTHYVLSHVSYGVVAAIIPAAGLYLLLARAYARRPMLPAVV